MNNLKIIRKIIFVFIMFFFLSLTFVTADIISVNSGGGLGFVITPGWGIEDFFLNSNRFPIASNVILNSSSGLNTTNENLTVYYFSYDLDGEPITNITDWRVDQNSIAVLNMPFDRRVTSISSGAVRDYSTYGNNGTLGGGVSTNSPLWNSSGKVGGAYYFEGSNNYLFVEDINENLDPQDGITVSMWVNFDEFGVLKSDRKVLVSKGWEFPGTRQYSFSSYMLDYYAEGKSLWWDIITCTYSRDCRQFISYDISSWSTGTWYHVAGTYDNAELVLYINGANVSKVTHVVGGPIRQNEDTPLVFGKTSRRTDASYPFKGFIDEAIIFDRALSPEQISSIYQAGLNGKQYETIVSQETNVGETWQVAITPNDVYDDGLTVLSNNLTIINAIPNDPTSVNLVSLNGRNESDTDLNCSAFVSDPDSSSLIVYIDWLKNDVSQFSQSFSNQINGSLFWALLGNGNLTLGDFWKCSVRISDSYDNSSWIDSNEVEIIDITSPNITIVSPLSPIDINYTNLEIDFNISIVENEALSNCYYDLNGTENTSMTEFNSTYYWSEPSNLIPGNHNVTFWCNDTSGNWGMNFTNFTILDEAAIAIQLSPSLSWNVNWSLSTIPVDDENATGNNGPNATDYYINVSVETVTADIYMRADGDLFNADLDVIKLGNETYAVNTTNSSVPNPSKFSLSTNYVLIASDLGDQSTVYLKFYLDAPASQPAGIYTNNLEFKAVTHGTSP